MADIILEFKKVGRRLSDDKLDKLHNEVSAEMDRRNLDKEHSESVRDEP